MLTALACLATLAVVPADVGPLEIVNAQPTYGYLGAVKPRQGVLPGDVATFRFDLKNMKMDAQGRAAYTLLVEVLDEKGQVYFRLGPHNAVAQNCLGGDLMPCSAQLDIPLDTPPGSCTLKVTITDRTANRSTTFEAKGKVLPADFGIVRVGTFADREGKVPTAPVGVLGGTLYVNFAAVGFARDKSGKQPDVKVSLRVLDAKGQPTMPVPLRGRANQDIPEVLKLLPMQFGLTLNRVGQFTVEVNASDELSGKSARVSFPIRVVAPE